MAGSISKERQVIIYPSPKYTAMIKAYADIKQISRSEAGAQAIKNFIDNLPEPVKKEINNKIKSKQDKNYY